MNCVVSLKLLFLSAATCNDNLMNQDETGVDCGGSTCPACRKYLYQRGINYQRMYINFEKYKIKQCSRPYFIFSSFSIFSSNDNNNNNYGTNYW